MTELISVAKWIGVPGSAGFFALCCAIGVTVAVFLPRARRIVKAWFVAVCAMYIAGALPVVSYALASRLPGYGPVWMADGPSDTDILVVFSGDNPAGRAQETRRVLRASEPRCVLVSGGPWFVRMLVAAGVERSRLTVDDTAMTTREQVAKLADWAEQCGARRVVLIASVLSMPRIAALVQSIGIPVLLAPSSLDRTPAATGVRLFLPSLGALRMSRDALYEQMAFAYYRWNKWVQ
jgi:uncharacterized SAM-binding protein YcdF (DUF218 family)